MMKKRVFLTFIASSTLLATILLIIALQNSSIEVANSTNSNQLGSSLPAEKQTLQVLESTKIASYRLEATLNGITKPAINSLEEINALVPIAIPALTPTPNSKIGSDSYFTGYNLNGEKIRFINGTAFTLNGTTFYLRAGYIEGDLSQSAVFLTSHLVGDPNFSLTKYSAPTSVGYLKITGRIGQTATLISTNGTTFTFDVGLKQFV
jgi:hypothetical protein